MQRVVFLILFLLALSLFFPFLMSPRVAAAAHVYLTAAGCVCVAVAAQVCLAAAALLMFCGVAAAAAVLIQAAAAAVLMFGVCPDFGLACDVSVAVRC